MYGALISEARLMKLPMRLLWMLLDSYSQPRVIRAFGCWSRSFRALQGILAGCTHATTLLSILTYRAIHRVTQVSPNVNPRALVDDSTLQWIGAKGDTASELFKGVQSFVKDTSRLGLLLQVNKSGWVSTAASARHGFGRFAQNVHLKAKSWVRNLGHELSGPKPIIKQAKARLKKLAERIPRLKMLRRATNKATMLWRTGLMPAAAHGATVSGVNNSELASLRQTAAMLAGRTSKSSSLTLVLATQADAKYDPIYDATLDPLRAYSSFVWDQRISLGRLQRAWQRVREVHNSRPIWASARGPIAVLMLSLARIGWDMYSSTVLVSDLGHYFDMLLLPPRSIVELVRQGIERWQSFQILEHHKDACVGGEIIWTRILRKCVGGGKAVIKNARFAGALRSLWSGALWSRDRLARAGYRISPDCCWCADKKATIGHEFYECPTFYHNMHDDPVLSWDPDLDYIRSYLTSKGQAGGGQQDYDYFETSVGMPLSPLVPPYVGDKLDIEFWGDWSSDPSSWSSVCYTDGSGMAPSWPELRRCGWSVVQLGDNGMPIRAIVGPLWGPIQTVGRAERFAVLQALRHLPSVTLVVYDLLGLVQEAESWSHELADAQAAYADIWRSILAMYPGGEGRPAFIWCPAHHTDETYLENASGKNVPWEFVMGNRWADFFAKRGALVHAQPETVVKHFEARLADCRMQSRFFSWAAAKMAARDQLSERPERLLRTPNEVVPALGLTEHQMVIRPVPLPQMPHWSPAPVGIVRILSPAQDLNSPPMSSNVESASLLPVLRPVLGSSWGLYVGPRPMRG